MIIHSTSKIVFFSVSHNSLHIVFQSNSILLGAEYMKLITMKAEGSMASQAEELSEQAMVNMWP